MTARPVRRPALDHRLHLVGGRQEPGRLRRVVGGLPARAVVEPPDTDPERLFEIRNSLFRDHDHQLGDRPPSSPSERQARSLGEHRSGSPSERPDRRAWLSRRRRRRGPCRTPPRGGRPRPAGRPSRPTAPPPSGAVPRCDQREQGARSPVSEAHRHTSLLRSWSGRRVRRSTRPRFQPARSAAGRRPDRPPARSPWAPSAGARVGRSAPPPAVIQLPGSGRGRRQRGPGGRRAWLGGRRGTWRGRRPGRGRRRA